VKYLFLIYQDEALLERMPVADAERIRAEYHDLADDLTVDGAYLGGGPLRPTSTATTLRFRDGALSTTDGPFAETKEQLGGYLLVEAEDLDRALEAAARLPAVRYGCVEVRPLAPLP